MQDKIGFIGGGNMAASLLGGLVANGYRSDMLWVAEPDETKRRRLERDLQVHTTEDNRRVVSETQVVVLAVKPQVMKKVVTDLAATAAARRPLIISIAAGVREPDIRRWFGYDASVVRTMPNTPALVQTGATALYANRFVSDAERSRAESILRAVGITLWLEDEDQLDAVTALSGSGPAYCFLLMELMADAGEELGLSRDAARMLSLETVFGAAKMALESADDAATLRRKVTSPGGTTERAIQILEAGEIRMLFSRALQGARGRAAELGQLLGES